MVLLPVLLALLFSSVWGCADAEDCPMDLPDESTCASDVPSYSREVSGVLDQYCAVCHLPGNGQSTKIFATYDQIYAKYFGAAAAASAPAASAASN